MAPTAAYARDQEYYIDDGNVILLVESTLFKVHRSMLMKDQSVFHGMFSPTQEHDEQMTGLSFNISQFDPCASSNEGESDDLPIHLPEVTVDQFRTLLWSLYALPAELITSSKARAEVDRFIDLATVSHRFQFVSMEQWSLQTLESFHAAQKPDYEPSILARLTAVSVLCDHRTLSDIVIAHWKRLIGEGRELNLAIEVAERHALDDLLAMAYLAMLRKGREDWPSEQKHVIRLLNGFYNLAQVRGGLPNSPPLLEHGPTCAAAVSTQCGENWRKLWKRVVNEVVTGKLGRAAQLWRYDVPALLMVTQSFMQAMVEETIPEHGGMDHMPRECRFRALEATKNRVKAEQANLISYFCDL